MQTRSVIGISCAALLLSMEEAGASERAVEASNFEVALAGAYVARKYGDSTSNSSLFGSRFTFPLGDFFGARVDAGYSQATLNNVGLSFAEDSRVKTTSAGLDLFYRNPDVLSVTASYGRDRARVSTSGSNSVPFVVSTQTNTIYSRDFNVAVEGYLRNITLAAGWDSLRYDAGGSFKSVNVGARWYITSDVRLGVSGSFETGSADNDALYSTGVEFQPAFLKQRVGVAFDYAWESNYSAVGVALKYYFGSRVNLITRDRHYR